MKSLFVLFALIISSAAQARQYIQCAEDNTFNRVVINLDGEKSTLFITNGVHFPDEERIVKQLRYIETQNNFAIYGTNEGSTKETIYIPINKLNVASSNFQVTIQVDEMLKSAFYEVDLSCFSSIHSI